MMLQMVRENIFHLFLPISKVLPLTFTNLARILRQIYRDSHFFSSENTLIKVQVKEPNIN